MQVMGEVCAKFQRLFLFCIALIVSFLIIFCSTEKKNQCTEKRQNKWLFDIIQLIVRCFGMIKECALQDLQHNADMKRAHVH